jgi:acyl-CoA thioesterase-1
MSMRWIIAIVSPCVFLASALLAPAEAQVVAFGASNVAGRGVSLSEAFPEQLEAMLRAKGYPVTVVNAGVSGDGSQQMLARIDQAIPEGTRVVILDVGGGMWNDARLHVPLATDAGDFATMRAKLSARGIAIVDLHSNYDMPPHDIQADGIHLTPEGHRLLASRLTPLVISALGEAK